MESWGVGVRWIMIVLVLMVSLSSLVVLVEVSELQEGVDDFWSSDFWTWTR
jgi:hypothetical protein